MTVPLYYESHVTTEPVIGDRLAHLRVIAAELEFRVADLLMANGERSTRDAFCSGRSEVYSDIHHRMTQLVWRLTDNGFTVIRYKIEAVLLDVRPERQ